MHKRVAFMSLAIVFLMSLCCFSYAEADNGVLVKDVRDNPGKYSGEVVTVKGTIAQFSGETATTMFYILKGTHGGIIQVITDTMVEETAIGLLHEVTGYVNIDAVTQKPVINETGRILLAGAGSGLGGEGLVEDKNDKIMGYVLYGLGGLAVLLVLIIVVMLITRSGKKQSQPPHHVGSMEASQDKGNGAPSKERFKTIVVKPRDRTMKTMPGMVEIMSGNDTGKEFPLAGTPQGSECVLLVGRDNPKALISLQSEHYGTVSENQAEFVDKGGVVGIRNLSTTNTTQVNGRPLNGDEVATLNYGDTITMGALKLKYKES